MRETLWRLRIEEITTIPGNSRKTNVKIQNQTDIIDQKSQRLLKEIATINEGIGEENSIDERDRKKERTWKGEGRIARCLDSEMICKFLRYSRVYRGVCQKSKDDLRYNGIEL